MSGVPGPVPRTSYHIVTPPVSNVAPGAGAGVAARAGNPSVNIRDASTTFLDCIGHLLDRGLYDEPRAWSAGWHIIGTLMALSTGTRLGPYEILSPLGAGGMGEVYRARDTRLDRLVAVKVLPSDRADSEEMRLRLEREARAVSSLNHPHICTLHDIGRQDGTDYLVMECLEGETLASRLERGPLPIVELLRVATQIGDALDKAHRHGLVHRDLKPGNV